MPYQRRYSASSHRLYGWFLSLASVLILTGLQLRAQLLLTRQITEQSPLSAVVPVSPLQQHQQHSTVSVQRHLILGTADAIKAFSSVVSSSSHASVQYVPMHSIPWAASCLQSLLTSKDEEEQVEYGMISFLLDATTTTTTDETTSYSLLCHRLRQRYPAAQIVVHRLSMHNASRTNDKFFSTSPSDVPLTMDPSIKQQLGTWGDGDACYWFQAGKEIPVWMEFNARVVQPFVSRTFWVPSFLRTRRLGDSPNQHRKVHRSHDYYYYNDAKRTLTVHNPFNTERMLYLTYKTGPEEALARIRLDGIPTVVIEPYRELYTNNDDMDMNANWETSPVGKVGPKQTTRVQWDPLSSPLAGGGGGGGTFRLMGVGFGAQKEHYRETNK